MALGQGYVAPDFDGSVIGISADVPSFEFLGQSSLVPSIAFGDGTPTFTRASGAAHTDFEGIVRQVPAGAARFQGTRYVKNLVPNSATLTTAIWGNSNVTSVVGATDPEGGTTAYTLTATAPMGFIYNDPPGVPAGAIGRNSLWIRRVTGVGTLTLAGYDNVNVDITASVTSTWRRISPPATTAGANPGRFLLKLTTSGDVVEWWHPQNENVTGQANQNPSEYVPALATANADSGAIGVRYFDYLNPNTVSNNIVTDNS